MIYYVAERTNLPLVAGVRSYDDSCGIARALDVIGERWTLLVVRELILGPKRFVDLRAGLGKLSANVLAQRLRELEEAGVVTRRTLPPPAGSRVYELTERGRELEPVLLALGRWGRDAPFPPEAPPLSADAAVLALPTTFEPGNARGMTAKVELRLGHDRFLARVRRGRFDVSRDEDAGADACLETDPATLASLLWHGARLAEAEDEGRAGASGDRAVLERFLTLFRP
jgi:DNA-binding HxlR family transcriptional regulator